MTMTDMTPAPGPDEIAPPDASASDAGNLHAAEQAIRQARAAQTRALAEGDHDLVASFWAADITVRRALGHAVSGAAACRQMLEAGAAALAPIVYQREAVTVMVSPQWPLAYEEGEWTGHAGRADSPAVIGGRYAAQWVQRHGRWLIRSELFVALTCSGVGGEFAALP
jgi:ketosteroid isomerase-like protein